MGNLAATSNRLVERFRASQNDSKTWPHRSAWASADQTVSEACFSLASMAIHWLASSGLTRPTVAVSVAAGVRVAEDAGKVETGFGEGEGTIHRMATATAVSARAARMLWNRRPFTGWNWAEAAPAEWTVRAGIWQSK